MPFCKRRVNMYNLRQESLGAYLLFKTEPMTLDTNTFLISILVLLVITILWIIKLELRIGKLLRGKGAKSIEESLVNIQKEISLLENFEKETKDYLQGSEKRLRRSIQAVKTIRFNPFKGTGAGGNQSFASAFVSEEGDGIVISSLYSRDRVSVFAKALTKFNSEYELSDEEKQVVIKAEETVK
jgi:hypothetical protein